MKHAHLLCALTGALLISGCGFGPKTPPVLMRLSAAASPTAAVSRTSPTSEAITVVPPTVSQELRTPRVPVRTGANLVAYVKDAHWVEMPSALFGRLLSETISARTGRVVLDAKQFTFDPGVRLTGTLHTFGLQGDTLEAVAIYDAALARGAEAVETRRFEARVPISGVTAAAAGPALNQAANSIAADVATWIGS